MGSLILKPIRKLFDVADNIDGDDGRAITAMFLLIFLGVAVFVGTILLIVWHWWLGLAWILYAIRLAYRYATTDKKEDG